MKRGDAPVYDALRLGLQYNWNQRGDEFLRTLGAVTGVGWDKIKRFMNGDDSALSLLERTQIEILQ